MFPTQWAQQSPASPVDVHLDLSGLAELIWRWLIDHIGEVGTAILIAITNTLHDVAEAIWNAVWHSSANILTQIPPDLTYNFGPYRAIATDPVPVAIGGATLGLVLLGLRTIAGAFLGRDHVLTHITARLIPSVFMTLAYPILIARSIGLINTVAEALGKTAIGQSFVSGMIKLLVFPVIPGPTVIIPYVALWIVLLYFAIRLLLRLAYGLFRLLVALVFGPVALILWAIPQAEWVTTLWLRELLGWITTPLLVTACLAMAMPMASGADGFIGAAIFGIAGFQAAYDLVGLLGKMNRSTNLLAIGLRHVDDVGKLAAAMDPGGAMYAAEVSRAAARQATAQFGSDK